MTIAFAFEIFLPSTNGVITSTLNLAENLLEKKHQILFFAPKRKDSPSMMFSGKVPVHFLPSVPSFIYPDLRFCWPFSKTPTSIMRSKKVDILHITGPSTVAAATKRSAHKLGIPVVHTWHTRLSDPKYLQHLVHFKKLVPIVEKISWKFYRSFLQEATITTPAAQIRDLLKSHYPDLEVTVISNGIDLRMFNDPDPYEHTRKSYPGFNNKTFIFVGRISREKSIDIIIRAIGEAQKTDDEIRLFVVGDGPQLTELRALAEEVTRKNSVIFTGKIMQQELIQSGLLHHARAFLSASTSEVQSIALIESICCRTPIIAANDRANSAIVGEGGLLMEPGNVSAFSKAVLQVLRDPQRYEKFQDTLKQLGHNFDGASVAETFEALYQSLLPPEAEIDAP